MVKISVVTPSIRPKGLEITQECLAYQTYKDFEWLVEIGYGTHDLNKAYNRMLRRAQGELVVFLQDYIKVPPTYLQSFWEAYKTHSTTFFTAPVGKVDTLEFAPPARWDWRAHRNTESMTSDCWEIDSACAPLALLKEIGGFDEALDGHWSCDNVNVGCRAALAGYSFMNLFENPALAYNHDKFIEHPFRETFNGSLNTKRMAMFKGGMKLKKLH